MSGLVGARQYAPTWLAQLPALLTDAELEAVQRRAQGATRERILRELIEAFDALAADTPFVLLLEDLYGATAWISWTAVRSRGAVATEGFVASFAEAHYRQFTVSTPLRLRTASGI